MCAITTPTLELPLPIGELPLDSVRGPIRRYRAGRTGPEVVIAAVDRHGEALETAIASRLARDLADYRRELRRLELLAEWIALRQGQAAWLRSFPHGPALDPGPAMCRMPSGHLVAVDLLLGPLGELVTDPRMTRRNGSGAHPDGRRGGTPVMAALGDAGLSTADLAAALDCSKTNAFRYLRGTVAYPPALAPALERLTDPGTAARIIALIPARDGDGLAVD